MRILSALLAFLLSSCVGYAPSEFMGPNSRKAYSIRCTGIMWTKDACYKKAGELCPGGYNILERQPSGGDSLVVECKEKSQVPRAPGAPS